MSVLLLVDSSIVGYEKLVAAAKPTVSVCVFDKYTDTFASLKERIGTTSAQTVGIVQHGAANAADYKLLETQALPAVLYNAHATDPSLESWSELQDFYRFLKSNGASVIDLISCSLYSNPDWVYVLQKLESTLGIQFRASTNETGNLSSGGDWIQESHGVNIEELYFTSAIQEFTGLLFTFWWSRRSNQMVAIPGAMVGSTPVIGTITPNKLITAADPTPENMVTAGSTEYGLVGLWGNQFNGGSGAPANSSSGISAIIGNEKGFAIIKKDGSAQSWGATTSGGSGAPASVSSGVVAITANYWAYAAKKSDGSVVSWGGLEYGGSGAPASVSSGVVFVASTERAFAALKDDGSVVAWGNSAYGGTGRPAAAGSGVVAIASNNSAFAVLKNNGSVVTWGNTGYGGGTVPAAAGSGVVGITSNDYAFAALKSNGSVVAWGDNSLGGGTPPAAAGSGVVAIAANSFAFAALKNDGSVVAWGFGSYGGTGVPAAAGSGVVAIASTNEAFAAIKADGSVVAWGTSNRGGSAPASVSSNVVAIAQSSRAFAALKSDGSVVVWGDPSATGIPENATTDVVSIAAAIESFNVIKRDGSVVGWGNVSAGSANPGSFSRKVYLVATTFFSFAGLTTFLPEAPVAKPARPIARDGTLRYVWTNSDPTVTSLNLSLVGSDSSTRNVVLGGSDTFYTFSGLTNGVSYTLSMYATNPNGKSNTITFDAAEPGFPPSDPPLISATQNGNTLTISWEAPTSGGTIQWYTLTDNVRYVPGGNLPNRFPIEPWKREFTSPPIASGTYTFELRAINSVGLGTGTPVGTFTFP